MNRYLQVRGLLIEYTQAESAHQKAQMDYNEALVHGNSSEIERAEHRLSRARAVAHLIGAPVVINSPTAD